MSRPRRRLNIDWIGSLRGGGAADGVVSQTSTEPEFRVQCLGPTSGGALEETKNVALEVAPVKWTIEEFAEWQADHLTTRADQKRWILAAKRLLGTLNIEPGDLLSDALLRIHGGKRHLNREVPIEVNLYGVMRSIASSWHKQRKRKPEISLDELRAADDGGTDVMEVLQVSDNDRAPSAEEELAYKQELEALLALFEDRQEAQLVVLGRVELGLRGADLAAFADLNTSQLATTQRLISRRLAGYRRDE